MSLQVSVICENLVTLSKEITYLELFNTFLIRQAKTPLKQLYVTVYGCQILEVYPSLKQ